MIKERTIKKKTYRVTAAVVSVLLLLLMITPCLRAENASGGQPGEFLYEPGVRYFGMGQAYVGLVNDVSSIYYNPAGLMRMTTNLEFYTKQPVYKPLYFEGNYWAMALAWSRPDLTNDGIGKYLFGPNSAWGFGFIRLSSDDYEHYTSDDQHLGTFGMYQQAIQFSYARRLMKPLGFPGIIDWGGTLKFVRAGVDGLAGYDANNGTGLDLGVQLQLFKPFSLRKILPLRLGLAYYNIIKPKVGFGNVPDTIPGMLRMGASYLGQLRDNMALLTAVDYSKRYWGERNTGFHLGSELQWGFGGSILAPRVGTYYLDGGGWQFTCGFGLQICMGIYDLKIDFAQGINKYLHDDQRISIAFTFGSGRGAGYLYKRKRMMETLSCYPVQPRYDANIMDTLYKAARTLGDDSVSNRPDESNEYNRMGGSENQFCHSDSKRFYQFIGDSVYIDYLVNCSRALLRAGKHSTAGSEARSAIKECGRNNFTKTDYGKLLKAEAYLIIAETNNKARKAYSDSAYNLLHTLHDTTRGEFLRARAQMNRGSLHDAIKLFREIERYGIDSADRRIMARLNQAECWSLLFKKDPTILEDRDIRGRIETLIDSLEVITKNLDYILSPKYPPYPSIADCNAADDAQCDIGRCYEILGDKMKALQAYSDVCRFYPDLDMCRAKNKCGELLDSLIPEGSKVSQ
jgi:tetratricopeptide (TPR) repeat protein